MASKQQEPNPVNQHPTFLSRAHKYYVANRTADYWIILGLHSDGCD